MPPKHKTIGYGTIVLPSDGQNRCRLETDDWERWYSAIRSLSICS